MSFDWFTLLYIHINVNIQSLFTILSINITLRNNNITLNNKIMKLGIKVLVAFLLIFIINCEGIRRRLIDHTENKKTAKKIKTTGFTRSRPVEQLGSLPRKRVYRTVHQVFGSSAPRRRSTGEVQLNKRDCNKLCSDRMPHKVNCQKVVATANENGSLSCVCLKQAKSKSVTYAQDDYCFHSKGCYQKNGGESCVN